MRIDISKLRTDRPGTFACEIRQVIEAVQDQQFTALQIVHLVDGIKMAELKSIESIRRSVRLVIEQEVRNGSLKVIRQGKPGDKTPGIYQSTRKFT